MITNESINQAIDYILQHIEDVTLDEVAEYCHFSKYYFCRLFKAQTGESVHGFIRRVRLEQSAFRLKVEQERPITEIGADYGYSSSNFSSAFRQHYRKAPIAFRKSISHASMKHPFFHQEEWQVESFKECNRKISVELHPDYHVIYERRFGSYEDIGAAWNGFLKKYQDLRRMRKSSGIFRNIIGLCCWSFLSWWSIHPLECLSEERGTPAIT